MLPYECNFLYILGIQISFVERLEPRARYCMVLSVARVAALMHITGFVLEGTGQSKYAQPLFIVYALFQLFLACTTGLHTQQLWVKWAAVPLIASCSLLASFENPTYGRFALACVWMQFLTVAFQAAVTI
ncbi:hypothetical protein M011DRAFT_472851 [Sporormia fimetaria CBS 119925]|uniref:Uncharacterized protein n=1 Tax=Sporormia fimetaria CBS 119925 TaxID=1340428 RepID=A0A6A6UW82_9PLEO|nr:hypothetical protein M011DRAFT_472851 [Sporormia fimetaria CBS 119925]